MALFSKKKENAGELPQRESAPAQDQGTEQESAQAGGLTKDAPAQTESSVKDVMQAEVPEGAASLSGSTKRRFGKKRALKRAEDKHMIRVKELEEALAEDEDIDVDAIVSMYMPKRRMARIGQALLRIGTLQKVLICVALFMAVLFGISFMQENMGNFTINLNRLELFRRGVAIADNSQFEGATARLTAEAVSDGTNIATDDLPNNLDEIDGSHNGKNYVAYTFYIRNAGKEDLIYNAKLKIASASKGVEKMHKLDQYLQTRFRLAFGNRIIKQMYDFIPVYVACGGTELGGMDYIIARKVLKKFESMNVSFVRDEMSGLIEYIEKTFGEGGLPDSISYLLRIQNMY